MSLYLLDKHGAESAVPYIAMDDNAKVFLVQDGLFLPPELFKGKDVFVLAEEVSERGLESFVSETYNVVGPERIISLILEEQVISFC